MRHRSRLIPLVALVIAALLPAVARAQLASVPVIVYPKQGAAGDPFTLHILAVLADWPLRTDNSAPIELKPYPSVLRAFYQGRRIRIHGGAGILFSDQAGDGFTVGAGAGVAFRSIERPQEFGLELQAGVGYTRYEVPVAGTVRQLDLPLAAAMTMVLPVPNVRAGLWTSPRLHLRLTDPPGASGTVRAGFGLSSGLVVSSLSGLGAHLGVEWLRLNDRWPAPGLDEFVLAVGVQWEFTWITSSPGNGDAR